MLTKEERDKLRVSMARNIDTIRAAVDWLSIHTQREYEAKDEMSDADLIRAAAEFADLADTLTRLVRGG